MTVRTVLLLALPVIAVFALTRARRLTAVIAMGLFSFVIAAVYLLFHAPDVGLTEAAIGAGLVTFIYILSIRKTGRLVILADEAPGLLSRENEGITGLEWEILSGFARELGLDPVVRFLPRPEIGHALRRGEGDIGAGGILAGEETPGLVATPGYLPTALFRISPAGGAGRIRHGFEYFGELADAVRRKAPLAAPVDLARFMGLARGDLTGYTVAREEGEHAYAFLVPADQPELHSRLCDYLNRLQESGKLDELVRRYLE